MKNFAVIFSILSIVVTPCFAQGDDECVSETTELSSNQAVIDAYDAMAATLGANLTADPFEFCDIGSTECNFDLGEYTSSFKITCKAEGGQIVERDVNASCNGFAVVPHTDFDIVVEGAPICVGMSCDPTAIPAEIEAEVETVVEDIVANINLAVNGNLTCDFEIDDSGGGGGEIATSGAQATTFWMSAAGIILVSSI
jgi:hypothetical protein